MFKRGDRVHHVNHGDGQIIEIVSEDTVECFFKNGMTDDGRGKLWVTVPTSFLSPMPKPETALSKMVEKLDNKRPGTNGYIAYTQEIIDILSELSKHVPANVFLDESSGSEVTVSLRLSFTLEREML